MVNCWMCKYYYSKDQPCNECRDSNDKKCFKLWHEIEEKDDYRA